METIWKTDDCLFWTAGHETLSLRPWGHNILRLQATLSADFKDISPALVMPEMMVPQIEIQAKLATITNGKLRATLEENGHVVFSRASDGQVLLEEESFVFTRPPARKYKPLSSDLYHLEVKFSAREGEKIFGLGQHANGFLDQKGLVIDLQQRNNQVSIPFYVSNLGYGFLWNNPSLGRVELGRDLTRWVSEGSRQVDYLVFAGDSPAEILAGYASATGHPPMIPEWALGFWQCKLRYRTQEELLAVAREYKRRGLPLSVIVADYFHWTYQGDWKFDPECWPDPQALTRELAEMGVRLMVSVWPTVNPNSENFQAMQRSGLLTRTSHGLAATMSFVDNHPLGQVDVYYYDTTHPAARQFIWEAVKKNYYDNGVRVFWLDACEPEVTRFDNENLLFHMGHGIEVSNIYPMMHEMGFYEGMRAQGETEIINLCRSGWAGSQRYGAAIWSGDIPSTFEMLRKQVRAGLNIALSGIPWWTTDIGGFYGGNINDPGFRELLVRWFQWGAFCPLFRLHGVREPGSGEGAMATGADNEVWSFGEEAYIIIKELLFLRERMKPYLMRQMVKAHETGLPPMRPLFCDFPADSAAWMVEDQFMLGPDVLVAPVVDAGAQQRRVYFPVGCDWQDAVTAEVFPGGQWSEVDAPLTKLPYYFRLGSMPF